MRVSWNYCFPTYSCISLIGRQLARELQLGEQDRLQVSAIQAARASLIPPLGFDVAYLLGRQPTSQILEEQNTYQIFPISTLRITCEKLNK